MVLEDHRIVHTSCTLNHKQNEQKLARGKQVATGWHPSMSHAIDDP